MYAYILRHTSRIIQDGSDLRRSLFQPPAQNRVSSKIRPSCSGLCPVWSWKSQKTKNKKKILARQPVPEYGRPKEKYLLYILSCTGCICLGKNYLFLLIWNRMQVLCKLTCKNRIYKSYNWMISECSEKNHI